MSKFIIYYVFLKSIIFLNIEMNNIHDIECMELILPLVGI